MTLPYRNRPRDSRSPDDPRKRPSQATVASPRRLPLARMDAVKSVLGARDHYSVLGAPRDAPAADLRQRFLRTSVRVHPDKNDHPQATDAFRRVAEAWEVLGDTDKRRRYDTDLRRGGGGLPGSGDCPSSSGQRAESSMSAEAAFAAFAAAATAAFASGGASGEFAEVLLAAQALAHSRGGGGGGEAQMIAGSGFALSAGLETAAAAANAAGFTGVGTAAHRAGSALRVASQVEVQPRRGRERVGHRDITAEISTRDGARSAPRVEVTPWLRHAARNRDDPPADAATAAEPGSPRPLLTPRGP